MSGVPFPVGLFTLLANHHGISQPSATVLEACFLLMAPFRTRFSPCEMARTANVQRLKGCLYTLWYCYIPICRFARHSLFPVSPPGFASKLVAEWFHIMKKTLCYRNRFLTACGSCPFLSCVRK